MSKIIATNSVFLYSDHQGSDKVYFIHLVTNPTASSNTTPTYSVKTEYGPRISSNLISGVSETDVTFEQAVKAFNKIVASKKKKGYRDAPEYASMSGYTTASSTGPVAPKKVKPAKTSNPIVYSTDSPSLMF